MSQLKSELAKQLSHLERKVEGICIMIIGMIRKKMQEMNYCVTLTTDRRTTYAVNREFDDTQTVLLY